MPAGLIHKFITKIKKREGTQANDIQEDGKKCIWIIFWKSSSEWSENIKWQTERKKLTNPKQYLPNHSWETFTEQTG